MIRFQQPRRAAFTLVELLVVVSIIVLLMGLLLPAVQKVRVIANRAKTSSEINQLNAAATAFMDKEGFYPPHNFTVPVRPSDPGYSIMKIMYPRWNPTLDGTGNITPALAYAGQTLTGNQSLVYFLGGPETTGWRVDGPYAPTGDTKKGPYMDFPLNRLVPGTAYGAPSVAPMFKDPFGVPYAYFGSNKIGGKYNPATFTVGATADNPMSAVSPFIQSAPAKFLNESTCQIISAGADKVFGPGGAMAPGVGPYAKGLPGSDDMSNTNGGVLLGEAGR